MVINPNQIIAHRGDWKELGLPENSVAALNEAIKIGYYGSEFDVCLTADNIVVVNHDEKFKGFLIEKSNYSDLQNHLLSNGETIPTLESFIITAQHQTQTKLILELKAYSKYKTNNIKLAAKVLAIVKKLNAAELVEYISFDFEICQFIMAANKNAKVFYLGGDKSPQELSENYISGINYHYFIFEKHPKWIKQALELNMSINVWTVNDIKTAKILINDGVHYITTDIPKKMLL